MTNDQLRIVLPQYFIGVAPLFPLATARCLNEDVRGFHEFQECLVTFGGHNIQHQVTHIAALVLHAPAILGPAIRVNALRGLQPNYVRAVFRKQLTRKGACRGYSRNNNLHAMKATK